MATKPVSIALKAEGINEVKSALKGVKQSFVEMEKESLAATKAASKERIALLKSESKEKIALLKSESAARKDIMQGEKSFAKALGRREGTSNFDAATKSLMKGGGVEDLMKQAGAAGVAFAVMAGAINLASASLRQFSSFVINDVIKPTLALQTRSQQVANNSGGLLTAGAVQSKARAIGLKNNMDPMALIEAAGRFQDLTGEPGLGFDIMGTIATISKGRGMDTKALSELAAAMYRPGQKAGDLNQLLMTLTGQGEKGSIPIGEVARLGGRLTAPSGKFGGDWYTQVTTGNALLQTAKRTGFGTVDEAATGLNKFVEEAFLKGKAVSPKSFATVNGVEKLTDPVKYLGDLYRKTGGNTTKLHAMGFSEESAKFIGAYQGTYSDAFKEAKAGGKNDTQAKELAATAVEEFVNSMKKQTSTMDAEESRRNAVMKTAGEQFATGLAKIESAVAERVMPDVEKLADAFASHAPEIAAAASALGGAFLEVVAAAFLLSDTLKRDFGSEGDVIKHVKDQGASTLLPEMSGQRGYWKQEDGYYQFVKGSGNEEQDVAGKGLKKMRDEWGHGVYGADKSDELGPATAKREVYSEVNGVLTLTSRGGKEITPEQAKAEQDASAITPGSKEAGQAAAAAANEHAEALKKSTQALKELASSAQQLNRTDALKKK